MELVHQTIRTFAINASDIGYTGATSGDSNVLTNVLNTVYLWSGIVAVIVIIIAGYLYVTSNGDPNSAARAKNAILGAVIGLVIIILAFAITNTVLMGLLK